MNILIGICGGISAYKICGLVRLFKKAGHDVNVIMTKNACEFITPLTLRTLSNNPVAVDMFDEPANFDVEHISLAKKADVVVIAPATANIIGKIASGIADDMLTTTVMATKAPVFIVPAMNTNMYLNKIVQKNIEFLKNLGYNLLEPSEGELACKDVGTGRLPDVEYIFDEIMTKISNNTTKNEIKKDLEGLKVLVTAGPTREPIDPVRYLTNHSSGKMGFAIADVAHKRGAKVSVVSGPTNIKSVSNFELIHVESAVQMHKEVMEKFSEFDIIIMVAAVADYRCEDIQATKIKKDSDEMILKLVKNPDIAKCVGLEKGNRILVGFCAETDEVLENAQKKIESKNLDIIVANDVTMEDAGFNSDTNIVTIIDKYGKKLSVPKMSKFDIAQKIIDYILEYKNI